MGTKKLQIFISSTYVDMQEERQCIIETILELGHIPAGMELFSADDKKQFEVIKNWIKESDMFLLILGGRYGSLDKDTGKSYIDLEYQYAKKIGKKPITVLLSDIGISNKTSLGVYPSVSPPYLQIEYLEFKKSLLHSRLCAFFDDLHQLKNEINKIIRNCEENINQYAGWNKGNKNENYINIDPGYYNLYNNKLIECLKHGVYDEYFTRILDIHPDNSKKVFKIDSLWKFKMITNPKQEPLLYFDLHSKSKLLVDTFKLLSLEINNHNEKAMIEKNLIKRFEPKNKEYYCTVKQVLPLKYSEAEVELTCSYCEPYPSLHYNASFMHPARSRNIQIILHTTEDWVIFADSFTAFKNMGFNIHSLYSEKSSYTENKDEKMYSISINEWTLPGTGYYYIVQRKN